MGNKRSKMIIILIKINHKILANTLHVWNEKNPTSINIIPGGIP